MSAAKTLKPTNCPATPFGNRKIYFRGLFSSVFVTIQKISTLWKSEINYLGIFQSLKMCILMGEKSFQFLLS